MSCNPACGILYLHTLTRHIDPRKIQVQVGTHRKYVAAVRPLVRDGVPGAGPPGRTVRRIDRLGKRPSGVVSSNRDTVRPDSLYPFGTSANDRTQTGIFELSDLNELVADSTPLSLPPNSTEVVPTPIGEEIVYPGWDRHPTVQMKAISPELIAKCRELPKTVQSMRAITIPPPPFRKVSG